MRTLFGMMPAVIFGMVLFSASSAEPDASPARQKNTTKTTIQSEYGDFDYKTKKGIFEGNVVVRDVEMNLKSDKMIVYLDEKDNAVVKVEAVGNVQIEHQGKTAYSDNAVYKRETGIILLTPKAGGERPRIRDDQGNTVRGDEIVIDRNANTMKATGHVQLEFTPDGKSGELFTPSPGSKTPSTNDTLRPATPR